MKTRPDGSAFRRSNVAYGRQPTQPRPRNDGFLWATPRHPDVVDELFVTCLPTSRIPTSAERNKVVR